MNILITGATGFIGSQILDLLHKDGRYSPVAAVRKKQFPGFKEKTVEIGEISAHTDWQEALKDCTVVIHAAARVHVLNEQSSDPLAEFRRVNVDGTLNLARQAAKARVRRFIFISSIKVNGEETFEGHPYSADEVPAPIDPYGISKYEAEQGLRALAIETGMEIVIIRPPLVYGAGVKGNFQTMIKWLKKSIPLPLGSINNKRSFVAVENLVSLIMTCIEHPRAANEVFLVSDDQDLSTSELLEKMGHVLERPVYLLHVPYWLINSVAQIIGKKAIVQRLFGFLQVDISKTKQLLNWNPPMDINDALFKTVQAPDVD